MWLPPHCLSWARGRSGIPQSCVKLFSRVIPATIGFSALGAALLDSSYERSERLGMHIVLGAGGPQIIFPWLLALSLGPVSLNIGGWQWMTSYVSSLEPERLRWMASARSNWQPHLWWRFGSALMGRML